MDSKYAIGIDVGGTTTKFGIVNSNGEIVVQGRIPSNEHDFIEDFIHEIYLKMMPMINQVGGIQNIVGIGMGAPNGNIHWHN